MNNIKLCAAGALMAVALSSCHIYKKYELPVNDSQIVGDFKRQSILLSIPLRFRILDGKRFSRIRSFRILSISLLPTIRI